MKRFLWGAAVMLLGAIFAACLSTPDAPVDFGLDYVPAKADTENTDKTAAEPMSDVDALEYFKDGGFTLGWNAGNTLDAYTGGVSGETKWGNPRLNQDLFDGVKAAGFNVLRIPITWMGQFGAGPDYHIKEDFLKRVAQVVDMAHQSGLMVIINLHHDGSTESSGKDNGWLSINKARASEEGLRQVSFQFGRIWAQIALYFKNYGDYLVFESMNEIHDGKWGWGNDAGQSLQYEIVNQWNQLFTDIVRQTGGNNASRYLVIPGYCTVPRHTLADYYKLPNDSGGDGDSANPGNSRFIVTVHYYDPHEFGIAGTRQNWGSAQDKQAADSVFGALKQRFVDNGIPVIIGESGAVYQQGNEETRIAYLSYVYGKAHAMGLVPIFWDNGSVSGNGEKFGLFDRATGKPYSGVFDAAPVIQAMADAVK